MSRKRKNAGASNDPIGEIRLGFDGLLGALGDVVSEISHRLEAGEAREVHKSFEFDTGKGPVRAEAGVRVRFADAGGGERTATSRSMSGPVNPERKPSQKRDGGASPRTIDFEIVEDEAAWRLIADIPGVARDELSLSDAEGGLVIETTGARRFLATCPLPEGVEVNDLDVSLRNGILELAAKTDETSST